MNCRAPRVADSFAARLAEWRDERGWKDRRLAERECGIRMCDLPAYGIKALRPRWKDGVAEELLAHFARINAIGAEALDQSAHWRLVPGGDAVTVAAIGDVMYCGRDSGPDLMDAGLIGLIRRNHDALFMNLEAITSPAAVHGRFGNGKFGFNAPPALLDTFAGLGLPVVAGLANNHVADRGAMDLHATTRELERRGLRWAGVADGLKPDTRKCRYALLQAAGHKIGIVPVTWGLNPGPFAHDDEALRVAAVASINTLPMKPGYDSGDLLQVRELIGAARVEGAEIIIVAPHWGHEFEYWPSPLHQMLLARELAAAGADVVVGSHPHVLQPLEVLHVNMPECEDAGTHVTDGTNEPRVCLVSYSLGNFTTYMPGPHARVGGLLSLEFREATNRTPGGGRSARRLLLTGVRLNATYAHSGSFLNALIPRRFRVFDVADVIARPAASDGLTPNAMRKALAQVELSHLAPWIDLAPRLGQEVRWLRPWWAQPLAA